VQRSLSSPPSNPSELKLRSFADSVKFDHFLALTDETGMLQHAKFGVPDRRLGYTTDDNARALVVSTFQCDFELDRKWAVLAGRFLAFLVGMQRTDGRLHNFMSYSREVRDDLDSGDHLGRALWATGCVVDSHLPAEVRATAKEVFDKALPWAFHSTSPRAWAHAIKGLSRYVSHFAEDSNAKQNLSQLVKRLVMLYEGNRSEGWRWFENVLSYENWRIPESLIEAYLVGGDSLEVAEESLRYLINIEFMQDVLVPVGSEGWYVRNGARAEFDQLPVEAGSAVETLVIAAKATGSSAYWDLALQALEWYHGRNLKKARVYDEDSGACYDGISPAGPNLNKGAESTLSYLLAVTRIRSVLLNKT